jgi:hypothetical protein
MIKNTVNCCKLYLPFMMLLKNIDFRVLPWGVLDKTVWISSLLGCLVSNWRQVPPKMSYFRRFCYTLLLGRTIGSWGGWRSRRSGLGSRAGTTVAGRSRGGTAAGGGEEGLMVLLLVGPIAKVAHQKLRQWPDLISVNLSISKAYKLGSWSSPTPNM